MGWTMAYLAKMFQLVNGNKNLHHLLNNKNKPPEEILADSWELIIQDFIEKYNYKPNSFIQLFYSESNEWLASAKHESKSVVNANGVHLKCGALIMREAITTEFIDEIKRYYLSNLNKILVIIENSVTEKTIEILRKANFCGYEVQLVIKYFIKNYAHPAHRFATSFTYAEISDENKSSKLLNYKYEQEIWEGKNLPKLAGPYSFLFVDVINNGSLRNKIYEI